MNLTSLEPKKLTRKFLDESPRFDINPKVDLVANNKKSKKKKGKQPSPAAVLKPLERFDSQITYELLYGNYGLHDKDRQGLRGWLKSFFFEIYTFVFLTILSVKNTKTMVIYIIFGDR